MMQRVKLLMERQPKIRKSCSFNGCTNNNRTGIPMHRFPSNKARCDVWVQAAQNEKLKGLSTSRLNNQVVLCSDHFQDWCFMNTASKKRLVHNAIPCSPKPEPPVYIEPLLEPSEASTGVVGKRLLARKHLQVLLKTPLPSQILSLKTPNKSPQKMKEELVDGEEEPSPESPTVSPVVVNNTTTISGDPNPVLNTSESQPVKKPRVTFYPIISKVIPQKNVSQKEDDEELELYLKLLARKLKSYKGLERRQIMHEIDGVFLRKQPSAGPSSTSLPPQFLMASFEDSASSSQSNAN